MNCSVTECLLVIYGMFTGQNSKCLVKYASKTLEYSIVDMLMKLLVILFLQGPSGPQGTIGYPGPRGVKVSTIATIRFIHLHPIPFRCTISYGR